jgi:hypothetical protein
MILVFSPPSALKGGSFPNIKSIFLKNVDESPFRWKSCEAGQGVYSTTPRYPQNYNNPYLR